MARVCQLDDFGDELNPDFTECVLSPKGKLLGTNWHDGDLRCIESSEGWVMSWVLDVWVFEAISSAVLRGFSLTPFIEPIGEQQVSTCALHCCSDELMAGIYELFQRGEAQHEAVAR